MVVGLKGGETTAFGVMDVVSCKKYVTGSKLEN